MYGIEHICVVQPRCPRLRFFAMMFPSLTDAERIALEDMATHGPTRTVPAAMRGRLALYRLIDETPFGWTVTGLGRQTLQVARPIADPSPNQKKRSPRPGESGRHYGKKTRDTSWFG